MSYSTITKTILNSGNSNTPDNTKLEYNNNNNNNNNDNDNNDDNDNDNNNNTTLEELSIRNVDKPIMYLYPNIYTKANTVKWLAIKIDTNFYHYDYCVKLFELLMKWVRINGFYTKTNEFVMLAKFCSLMYFMSNKRGYKECTY